MLFVRKMPFPWELAAGLTIHYLLGSDYIASYNYWSSFGKMNVKGTNP